MQSRRQCLKTVATLAGGLALSGLPSAVADRAHAKDNAGRGERLRAPRLRPGDGLGLVAPAGFIGDRFGIEEIAEAVRAMGLEPTLAPNLTARAGYLAGEDAARAAAFMETWQDPRVKGVMAVRGGWGTARILPRLDFAALRRHPKLFTGFSDNTALHAALAAHGCAPSLHGPNASASWPLVAWESWRALAFEGATPTLSVAGYTGPSLGGGRRGPRVFAGGQAQGRLLGGNLSVLSALVGTPYFPDMRGAVLFLEDTNESEYRIDRMLTQLALAGVLKGLAGVVFGQCTNCRNPGPGYSNFTIYEVLDQHFGGLGIPAFQGLSIGHIAAQASVPVGCQVRLDADAGTLQVLEPVVI
ncbi:S66 peptidase family protein [Novosphingobium sp. MBES04]|uniref:S66 peptidase family protein n=1 Tax=Novosphingobium sp. MBES04 TaxID=1206458 RepID=UPI00057DDDE4|nr:LD-carboxypeptidase [Novosphingobium sp. MBES04]GAM04724.1 muramoyltetrapeptide carboxypeptidase [Novosphingobium sp. MBES04]